MAEAVWHKSSYSNQSGSCVEVRTSADQADVRDTKNPQADYLTFDRTEWSVFIRAVQSDTL
ncbi:DUF397 domain-containing protein [Allonocardiopsis opalescens]|uniref:Uncharacterized protein DUF397 n=1 Tax=Allonocardiopsis opalescens TaxID=1144618 RepID=A0A2T0QCC6_9ACTN|nr:DUF397 domain-containing protein [Allonocardiopsis opalescens]PRY01569.1 uncharacterized protein DUF397 [Allonocardiopsis opalescens]